MTTLAAAALLELARLSPDAPAPPPAAAIAGPLLPPALWDVLPAPDEVARALIARRAPWIDLARVRELTRAPAMAVFAAAAGRGDTLLDVFTDDGLMTDRVFYVSATTLEALDRAFELPLLYPVASTDLQGRPFRIVALLMGAGRTEVHFDRGPFVYETPWFPNYFFRAEDRVTQVVQGPGSIALHGLSVDLGIARPRLLSVTKVGPREALVESTAMDRRAELRPVVPR